MLFAKSRLPAAAVTAALVLLQCSCAQAEEPQVGEVPGEADPLGEVAMELSKFNLFVFQEIGELDDAPPREVITAGELVGKWKDCRADFYNQEDCYTETPFSSRIDFEFDFDIGDGFTLEKPSLNFSGGAAKPQVIDFLVDEEDRMGFVTVTYGCQKASESDTIITLTMQIAKGITKSFSWGKSCRDGLNEKMKLVYLRDSDDDRDFGPSGTDDEVVVSPTESSSKVGIFLEAPGRYQEFQAPKLNVSGNIVNVQVRGVSQAASIAYRGLFELTVIYECHKDGDAVIRLTVPIPPWDPLVGQWRKDCGGGKPKGLTIGTSADTADILVGGELSPAYAMDVTSLQAKANGAVIDKRTSSMRFWFSNENVPGAHDLNLQDVVITIQNTKILFATVVGPTDSSSISRRGTDLSVGASKHLDIHFICKSAGASSILVTIPTLKYQHLEFGFAKECEKPKKIQKYSTFTAGRLTHLLALVAAVVLISGVYFWWRRRNEPKHELIVPNM